MTERRAASANPRPFWADEPARADGLPSERPTPPPIATGDEGGLVDADVVRRLLVRIVAACAVVVLAGSVAVLVGRDGERSTDATTTSAGTATSSPLPGSPATLPVPSALVADVVGPLPGTDVASYVLRRITALAAADGKRIAIVSFSSYTNQAGAEALLAKLDSRGFFVAPPGGESRLVRGSLPAWATKAASDAKAERAELLDLIPTTTDEEYRRQYQADADRLARFIGGIDPKGQIVFGAVVVSDVERLRVLAADGRVRLVDVGGSSDVPADDRLAALRPEETIRSGDPQTRPAP